MMKMLEAIGIGRLMLLAVALALALATMGCATTGPLATHGVDYAPSFNPESGEG